MSDAQKRSQGGLRMPGSWEGAQGTKQRDVPWVGTVNSRQEPPITGPDAAQRVRESLNSMHELCSAIIESAGKVQAATHEESSVEDFGMALKELGIDLSMFGQVMIRWNDALDAQRALLPKR